MKISQQATKGHLTVGAALVALSLGSFVIAFFLNAQIMLFLIFFFGVWGGVELGRYLEHWIASKTQQD